MEWAVHSVHLPTLMKIGPRFRILQSEDVSKTELLKETTARSWRDVLKTSSDELAPHPNRQRARMSTRLKTATRTDAARTNLRTPDKSPQKSSPAQDILHQHTTMTTLYIRKVTEHENVHKHLRSHIIHIRHLTLSCTNPTNSQWLHTHKQRHIRITWLQYRLACQEWWCTEAQSSKNQCTWTTTQWTLSIWATLQWQALMYKTLANSTIRILIHRRFLVHLSIQQLAQSQVMATACHWLQARSLLHLDLCTAESTGRRLTCDFR